MIKWDEKAPPFDWADRFDQWTKEKLEQRDFESLLTQATQSSDGKLSIPTMDHWYPFLYILGCANKSDRLEYVFEGMQNASISMRSLIFK
jgi:4,5-DOPA dioxygenase extradiol